MFWVRLHFKLTQFAFVPDEAATSSTGPRLEQLEPYRLTRAFAHPPFDDDGPPYYERCDFNLDYYNQLNFQYDLKFTWVGYTVFIEKADMEQDTSGRYDTIASRQERLDVNDDDERPSTSTRTFRPST